MFAKPRAITGIPRLLLPGARPFSSGDKAAPPPMQPLPAEYRQLDNLDFMTAAKILFTEPPKKKKFGFDFHLVQFFFACMPSLAVYLVAQYARYEIRRMEAEVEKKKQAEEEEKAKEAELDAEEEKTELSKVMVRLDVLEEAVKEIVDDKKKTSESDSSNNQKAGSNNESISVDQKKASESNSSNNEKAGSNNGSISVDEDSSLKSKTKEGELAVHRKKETTSSFTPPASIAEEDKKRYSGIGKEDASVGHSK